MKHVLLSAVAWMTAMVAGAQVALPSVSFDKDFVHAQEDGGSVQVVLRISNAPVAVVSVEVIAGSFATAQEGIDFEFEPQLVLFPAGSEEEQVLSIPVVDNGQASADRLFTLKLVNAQGATIGAKNEVVIFLQDDEEQVPATSDALTFEFVSSFLVDPDGSAEIVAYNRPRKRLYVLNSTAAAVEILDFSDPRNIEKITTVDMTVYGAGATSVACNNAIVAASVDGVDGEPGKVVFMNKDGVVLSVVTVGYLPDMIVFTPDNQKVLVANEGEPTDGYSSDPEGTISVIDISGGANGLTDEDVATIDFHAFDGQEEALRAQGIRIFGWNANVSRDLEPEYITVSTNSQKAWVTLQENNAIAELDLVNNTVTAIRPLGTKDHSIDGNTIDVSDRNDSIFMANWSIRGMYMPDAIASYTTGGATYLVTANEGDQREYGVVDEDVAVRSGSYALDPLAFPNASLLKKNHMLGRLAVSPYSGDTDGDGDFDEIHCFGGRSFSIWNAASGDLVFDSGDDFERITSADPVFGSLFNASNDNNTFKNRSDNKGPEPEGVVLASANGRNYAFITLERTGGFMAYDVTDPLAPEFISYQNSRLVGEDEGGDLGPEGIIYIDPQSSPSDTAIVVLANEISATVSVYYVTNLVRHPGSAQGNGNGNGPRSVSTTTDEALVVYPNPVENGRLYFSKPIAYSLFSVSGQKVLDAPVGASMDTRPLPAGIYLIVTTEGEQVRVLVN